MTTVKKSKPRGANHSSCFNENGSNERRIRQSMIDLPPAVAEADSPNKNVP
jgi:hypothetical protein